jgi:hypothetical protein
MAGSLSRTSRLRRAVLAAITAVVTILAAGTPGSVLGGIALTSADVGTFTFPDGITLTVAPGWTISCTGKTWVCAEKPGSGSIVEFSSGDAHAADITDDFASGINLTINVNGLSRVLQEPASAITTVQGKNFTQTIEATYTADRQTNQGTRRQYGLWIDLFNPSTHTACFVSLSGISADAVQAAVPDTNRMINSIL